MPIGYKHILARIPQNFRREQRISLLNGRIYQDYFGFSCGVMKLQPGKFRACEWEILLFWGFQYRWTERCRAIPGYTSLVCRKLTPTNSLLFSKGIYHLFPSYFPLILSSSSLPEFERRSQGSIRGDAKKFALERAQDFIVRFGLSDEFHGVEEPESRFKEVRNFLLV
jgi:hypothetical protein